MAKGRRSKSNRREPARHAGIRPCFSGYSSVWMFALFDLPVVTKQERKAYANFRKLLLDEGFGMLQYSVYARWYRSEESAEAERNLIRSRLPKDGQVRLLVVTDRQFGKMEVFYGKKRKKHEEPPHQLLLF